MTLTTDKKLDIIFEMLEVLISRKELGFKEIQEFKHRYYFE